MKTRTRSILEEISLIGRVYDQKQLIEQNSRHLIASYAHLVNLLRENFPEEHAHELERRLISSLRSANEAKFVRGIQKYSTLPKKSKEISSNLLAENPDDLDDDESDSGQDTL